MVIRDATAHLYVGMGPLLAGVTRFHLNIEYMKASIRAKVEHPFRFIKCQFGFIKARYRGLMKNDNKLAMLFALANLVRVDQMLRAS